MENKINIFNSNRSELDELTKMIESIMSISDDALNSASLNMIKGMFSGAFTPEVREQTIQQILTSYKKENKTASEIQQGINDFNLSITELIDELHPSAAKAELLNFIFDIFVEMFEEAKNRYSFYDIELPVTLEEGAKAPTYAHDTDACADIYALEDMILPAHSISNKVRTGLRIALPKGWVMKIAPRSSIGSKTGLRLSNSIGVIDADYRGEIGILYDNISDSDYEIKAGDRIAQCWVEPIHQFKAVVVEKLDETERGAGGFGSTGV